METSTLGITEKDARIIEALLMNVSYSLLDLSVLLRKTIKDIHNGHFLYLAYVYGVKKATYENSFQNSNQFFSYAKN